MFHNCSRLVTKEGRFAADIARAKFDRPGRGGRFAPSLSRPIKLRRLLIHNAGLIMAKKIRISIILRSVWIATTPFLLAAGGLNPPAEPNDNPAEPNSIERAVVYLKMEVPLWSRENGCFSCHNNGDGARALIAARTIGLDVPDRTLADTIAWLSDPNRWTVESAKRPSSDRPLARVQFASALADAVDAGLVKDRSLPLKAASLLIVDQGDDGAWKIGDSGRVGAPATYGPALATWTARDTLARADQTRFKKEIARADQWIDKTPIRNIQAASIALMAIGERYRSVAIDRFDPPARDRLKAAIDLLARSQGDDGGWGPFESSPAEPFDTALALIALQSVKKTDRRVPNLIDRGRTYLRTTQLAEGGWPATTRPAGGDSYAEHISTSAWATIALIKTHK
jgi:hypothetical protein